MSAFNLSMLLAMKHSPVRNYVIPGLTSWLIGAPGPQGCIRLFESERETQEFITPHSHRFDFQCWVLAGWVRNRIWTRRVNSDGCDFYYESKLRRGCKRGNGSMGEYTQSEAALNVPQPYTFEDTTYDAGAWYSMGFKEIHSIAFSRGAKVLFFEGPEWTHETTILEPRANGVRVPTFKVEPWMFDRSDVSPKDC